MPKATLQFDLPEEREEFENTLKAGQLIVAACDYGNWLRTKRKYQNAETVTLEEAEREFWDLFGELIQ